MTPNQYTILEALKDGPRWARSFQTVKPLVNELIERGYIERCRPHLGRWQNMLRLTAAGCVAIEVDPSSVPSQATATGPGKSKRNWELGPIRDDASDLNRKTCEAFLRALKSEAEIPDAVGGIAAQEGVERPAIWRRLRAGGVLKAYQPGKPLGPRQKRPKREEAGAAHNDMPRVYRDPCPRCGARGDYNCGHSKAPLGMVL